VALGAAVQAGLAAGDAAVQDLVLTDVSAHTLGIETAKELAPGHTTDGYFTPIIERNTTVPVSRSQNFQTMSSGQDSILLKIYQGEARLTKDNHLLGSLRVTGLQRPHPETASIEVRFSYDMSGLLEVDVQVLHSGERFHTVIEERPGSLSSRQVEEIRARLAPLKFTARERLQNRARLERANRVFAQLLGEPRAVLAQLVMQFEMMLETAPEAVWEDFGKQLDRFLAQYPLEEGHWQPPTGDAGPSP
jgi:molecular chaperone HscC